MDRVTRLVDRDRRGARRPRPPAAATVATASLVAMAAVAVMIPLGCFHTSSTTSPESDPSARVAEASGAERIRNIPINPRCDFDSFVGDRAREPRMTYAKPSLRYYLCYAAEALCVVGAFASRNAEQGFQVPGRTPRVRAEVARWPIARVREAQRARERIKRASRDVRTRCP